MKKAGKRICCIVPWDGDDFLFCRVIQLYRPLCLIHRNSYLVSAHSSLKFASLSGCSKYFYFSLPPRVKRFSMDAAASGTHDQHQKDFPKDFLNSFFNSDPSSAPEHDLQRGRHPDIFHAQPPPLLPNVPSMMNIQQQGMANPQVNMDVIESLMAMQDRSGQSSAVPQAGPTSTTPQMLLEQQMRLNQLQQLQQLQNQIFQQQLELLSSNPSYASTMAAVMDRSRDAQSYGLPTPGPSNEIHAQHTNDFVSPMMLQTSNSPSNNLPPNQSQVAPNFMPQHLIPPTPHSAPANIAFSAASYPLTSPVDPDYTDFSLESPWLEAYNNNSNNNNNQLSATNTPNSQGITSNGSGTAGGKKRRTASPSDEEVQNNSGRPLRKRQSTSRVTTVPSMAPTTTKKASASLRGTRSANSTPLFPPTTSTRQMNRHQPPPPSDIPGDTPSPVDLSMPPPAPRLTSSAMQFVTSPSGPSTQQEPLMPVTPASIMNLGRLGTNSALAPPPPSNNSGAAQQDKQKRTSGRTRSSTVSSARGSSIPGPSPVLKPIRPGGSAATSQMSPLITASSSGTQPILQVRKTSHKAAEQKRRDSLKTSFDDLRVLLPPIPLPSEEGYPDEPVLPGAMPPRGPPKGNVDGPNRGVSKLQLLRCGNDYIRVLKARVDRRDEEIERLRKEIERLRLGVDEDYRDARNGEDPIDLEKDLDACEVAFGGIFGKGGAGLGGSASGMTGSIPEADEGEEDGE
ncbi:hypothetical protein C8Q75DRAFT_593217 [Abortiporus biennis]|nr:hypothetical protein C8Q75DRAFT_593217 [Abortiporus biennis]